MPTRGVVDTWQTLLSFPYIVLVLARRFHWVTKPIKPNREKTETQTGMFEKLINETSMRMRLLLKTAQWTEGNWRKDQRRAARWTQPLYKKPQREKKKTLSGPKHPSCLCFCDGKLLVTSPADVKLCWLGRSRSGMQEVGREENLHVAIQAEASSQSFSSLAHQLNW